MARIDDGAAGRHHQHQDGDKKPVVVEGADRQEAPVNVGGCLERIGPVLRCQRLFMTLQREGQMLPPDEDLGRMPAVSLWHQNDKAVQDIENENAKAEADDLQASHRLQMLVGGFSNITPTTTA